MNIKVPFFLLFCFAYVGHISAQYALSLSPSNVSPSSVNLTVTTAGDVLSTPINNYTSQNVIYTWPKNGGGFFYRYGAIAAYSSSIPAGMTLTVKVGGTTSSTTGTPGGTKTVTSDPNNAILLYNISQATNVSRALTQNLTITDFSQLYAGTFIVQWTLGLYYYTSW